ncbi:MAG: hypothetical protein Q8O31_02760 [Rhodocyclaceae bacterium]|nr:hypothetical protein [Rhodocyclaceae bacterium]
MKHAPLTPIPTPTLPLKGRERCSSPLKGRERCSSPFKGEAGRGMGNVFHVNKEYFSCIKNLPFVIYLTRNRPPQRLPFLRHIRKHRFQKIRKPLIASSDKLKKDVQNFPRGKTSFHRIKKSLLKNCCR